MTGGCGDLSAGLAGSGALEGGVSDAEMFMLLTLKIGMRAEAAKLMPKEACREGAFRKGYADRCIPKSVSRKTGYAATPTAQVGKETC